MVVGAFDKDSARLGVLDTFNESISLISEGMFVNILSITLKILGIEGNLYQIVSGQVINSVNGISSASEDKSFHISSLSSSQSDDTLLGKRVKAEGINTLLIDDNKGFVSAFTNFSLKVNNLLASFVSEFSFTSGELLSLFSSRVEESRIDFGLFVFEGYVTSQNIAILKSSGHIWVSGTVVKDEASNQSAFSSKFMGHMHHLDHEEINWLIRSSDDIYGINDYINEPITII